MLDQDHTMTQSSTRQFSRVIPPKCTWATNGKEFVDSSFVRALELAQGNTNSTKRRNKLLYVQYFAIQQYHLIICDTFILNERRRYLFSCPMHSKHCEL